MIAQLVINTFVTSSTILLVASGLLIILRVNRFINFSHGIVVTSSAYLFFIMNNILELPIMLGTIISLLVTILLGCVIEISIFRPLRYVNASSLILLLTSLGVYIIIQNIISLIFEDDTKIIRLSVMLEGFNFLGGRITAIQIVAIITSMVLVGAVLWGMKKTRMGKAMRALANDPELSAVSGIDSDRITIWVFGIGSALAGVAGILVAIDIGMTPTMGLNVLMLAVVAVIIGGVGSIPGMALGALLLAAAQQFASWQFGSQWQDSLAFAILLVFLLIRPQGFLGRKPRKATL